MKIDYVLVSANVCGHYLELFPLVFRIWKERFNIYCYLILISDHIPLSLEHFSNYIILFPPIEGINDIFVAQTIRILYPALFDNKNILISDIDIFPISDNYFIKSIEHISDDKFVTYTDRYVKQNMYAICYNVANSNTWKEIFKINSIDDIVRTLRNWYNVKYDGTKNCEGWFTDQLKLYEIVNKWKQERVIILKDRDLNFKRLDKRHRNNIVKNIDLYKKNLLTYTDFHCIKPYSKLKHYILVIINEILNS